MSRIEIKLNFNEEGITFHNFCRLYIEATRQKSQHRYGLREILEDDSREEKRQLSIKIALKTELENLPGVPCEISSNTFLSVDILAAFEYKKGTLRFVQDPFVPGEDSYITSARRRFLQNFAAEEKPTANCNLKNNSTNNLQFTPHDLGPLCEGQSMAKMPLPRLKPNGGDSITPIVWEVCYDLFDKGSKITALPVMSELKIRAQSNDPKLKGSLVGTTAGGVKYEYGGGDERELVPEQLRARINFWKEANGINQPEDTGDKP
jgi:hypothetical protein